ncbi:probable ATP-dependent DNA helicase HFM1 [Toxorhynchites rutilus septentrionalis]|uniref:probable ATP-dependent DNA helicase HFM1 n=1 Tax=Toxorhynchites rutilus septentrionalis TaxID=329112 RepID=UPI00247916C8|nr:probable ATP-dependent DNA helicase HFM1 [Toxorhynchites rutilus septentrionalis]
MEEKQPLISRNWSSHPRPSIYTGRTGNLRSVEEIAPVFHHVFHEFSTFNEIQSMVMDDILYTDKSLAISAPTGSGKTTVFELAMVRLLMQLEDGKFSADFKMVYIAPIKALCAEKLVGWKGKFEPLGIKCVEVTGDTEFRDLRDLTGSNLILTTPEKWNSITRWWRENVDFVRSIRLVMIDEVHILNDALRGPTMEAVITRMRSIHRFVDSAVGERVEPMRIIALSATVPNVADLAAWVGDGQITCYYNIDESRRPIKIQKHVLGYHCDPNTSSYRFDINLNYKLFEIVSKYSGGRPTLVFCSTRKATETATNHLVERHPLRLTQEQCNVLQSIVERIQNTDLKRCLLSGYGYHHAGVSFADRKLVEESFRAGRIPLLCCTSSLAMGVNLPAHLVIIKSTQMYTDYGMEEYSESSIFQMIGRAGRPQFDTSGVAVIMTQRDNVQKYERLATGSVPIESFLHEHLAEHLNSEIVLRTIVDLASAMDWIRSTFFYKRALAAPAHYGFSEGLDRTQIERNLEEFCQTELWALEKYALIKIGKDQGADGRMTINSTLYGRLMAQYCLRFRTVKLLRKIKGTEPLLEMFTLLMYCDEFSAFRCRNSDKRMLNELNRSNCHLPTIRFPLRGRIQNTSAMTSCLIQAVLGNLPIGNHSLQQEASRMVVVGRRLARCAVEFLSVGQIAPNPAAAAGERDDVPVGGVYRALISSLTLRQCLEAELWENSPYVAKQLKGIGAVYSNQLAARGKITFREIMDTDPRELEVIVKKAPPFGNNLIDFVRKLPVFSIHLVLKPDYMMEVTVVQHNQDYDRQIAVKISVLVGDTNNNVLFFMDNCDANPGGSYSYQTCFKLSDATVTSATGHVICSNWVGLDSTTTVVINEDGTVTSTTEKHRTRRVAGASKKITEYYHKQSSNEIIVSSEDETVSNLSNYTDDFNATLNTIPTITIDSSPRKRSLESFRFTQKPRLSLARMDSETHNTVVEIEPKRLAVDVQIYEICKNKQSSAHSGKPAAPLAPYISPPTGSSDAAMRREYFKKMFQQNPFLLFGRPEDQEILRQRQQSPVRRVCLFGVFTEIPRNKPSTRHEREAFRTMYSPDGHNGSFYRKNYYHKRRTDRELDLGIDEFLSSAPEPEMQKENFFK